MIKFVTDEKLGQLQVNDHDGVFDADQAIFFARQLEHIKARSYDVQYAELKFRKIFPLSNEARPGTAQITFRTYDKVGMAKIISSYADDLPRADIAGKEETSPVRAAGIAVGYNTDEIRKAALTGFPLDARRMNAAMRGHEQLFNYIAWYGDDNSNLKGVFNHPNLSISTVATGVGGYLWTEKTPDEILADLNAMAYDPWTDTYMVETPNTLCLPPAKYAYIASRPRSSVSDTTILAYFLANQPHIKNVEPVNELTGAGTAGADVMMAYNKSPDKLTFEIPMEPIYHPQQLRGLEVLIPSESNVGGLIVYYPASILLREGF